MLMKKIVGINSLSSSWNEVKIEMSHSSELERCNTVFISYVSCKRMRIISPEGDSKKVSCDMINQDFVTFCLCFYWLHLKHPSTKERSISGEFNHELLCFLKKKLMAGSLATTSHWKQLILSRLQKIIAKKCCAVILKKVGPLGYIIS